MSVATGLFVFIFSLSVFAGQLETDRQLFLKEFSKNPHAASEKLPIKYNAEGKRIQALTPFTEEFIQNREFVKLKDQRREEVCGKNSKPGTECQRKSSQFWAHVKAPRDIEYFTEAKAAERNLEKTHAEFGAAGQVAMVPWSGDYWATAKGGIAARFADPTFPGGASFNEIWEYMNSNKDQDLSQPGVIESLSPAEKYDLLVGDANKSLTDSVLSQSQTVWAKDGKIEDWWGICHGWAPAALVVPRPRRFVQVAIPGLEIPLTFYPDDIKALVSHFWAHTPYQQLYIGGRCDDINPATDANGRVLSEACFDVNPGSFHLALLHQVGKKKESFIMDATYDYEVWNQPVTSYNYVFFNPETKAETPTMAGSVILAEDFMNDPYKKYRSSKAHFIVGVAMTVNYIKETTPTQSGFDSESNDNIVSVQYFYDLELNTQGHVIGGEWYQQAHPDFLWRPASAVRPSSIADSKLEGTWLEDQLPPTSWTQPAQEAARYSQPLYKVLEELVRRAQ